MTETDDRLRRLDGELLSPSRIGDLNRSLVIQALCDFGPLSRAELAKMARVSRATIGNIVLSLIDAGLVDELDAPTDTGRVGKPARPVWFGPRAGLSGAVALGEGTLEAALVNARGEVLARSVREFDTSLIKDVTSAIRAGLRDVLPRTPPADGLLGVGVAVPGVCDTTTGTVLGSGQIPALDGVALGPELGRSLDTEVVIDNDSRAQALGEKWFGAGRRQRHFASVQTGHGIGVGLVLDGDIYRGTSGEAGEVGHTAVVPDGALCRCGLYGCWETIATLGWLRREAGRRGLRGARRLDSQRLVELACGSPEARSLLERYADNIAIGLANLTQLLNPQLFILHGDVVRGGETMRGLIEERTRARSLGNLRDDVRVALSELDQIAGLLGAAGLVLSKTFDLRT